jgi:hypothetical protein
LSRVTSSKGTSNTFEVDLWMSSLFRKAFIMFSLHQGSNNTQFNLRVIGRDYSIIFIAAINAFLIFCPRSVRIGMFCKSDLSNSIGPLPRSAYNRYECALSLHLLVKAMLQHRCFEVLLMSANLILLKLFRCLLLNKNFFAGCILTGLRFLCLGPPSFSFSNKISNCFEKLNWIFSPAISK